MLAAVLLLSCSLLAQTGTVPPQGASSAPATQTADTASPDALLAALYDVISGPAGQKRDWERFRALFAPDARMIIAHRDRKTGEQKLRTITPEDYIKMSGPVLEERGFFEKEISRKAEQFAHIYHAWSTYEARQKQDDAKPMMRGINSIQLFNDGTRWSIATVYWEAETPETPLPEKYVK